MTAYWKSILAAIGAGVASLITAVTDDPSTVVNESTITTAEWLIALGAVVAVFGGVAVVKNAGFVNLNKAPSSDLLAAKAYEAYRSEVRNKLMTTAGPLPSWGEADAQERAGWYTAAGAVLSDLRSR